MSVSASDNHGTALLPRMNSRVARVRRSQTGDRCGAGDRPESGQTNRRPVTCSLVADAIESAWVSRSMTSSAGPTTGLIATKMLRIDPSPVCAFSHGRQNSALSAHVRMVGVPPRTLRFLQRFGRPRFGGYMDPQAASRLPHDALGRTQSSYARPDIAMRCGILGALSSRTPGRTLGDARSARLPIVR